MNKSMAAPSTLERINHCTEEEVRELCEALYGLGYPRSGHRSAMTALKHCILRRYQAGEVVIREGAKAREAYVVRSGRLAVMRRAGHQEQAVSEVLPGGIVGEMGLLSGRPRTATVKAAADSELFVIDDREFDLLLHSHPKFRHEMEGLAHARRLQR